MSDPVRAMHPDSAPELEVLITAEEAWPAFERAVLQARSSLHGSFRVFDLRTRLRSSEAQAVGKDWFDLLTHVIRRGVSVTLVVSDFDPVMATPLHELTWQTVRQGAALAEIANAAPGQVSITAALHDARAGILPWGILLPAVLKRKWDQLAGLSKDRLTRQAVLLNKQPLPELRTVTHHQKLAVVDDDTLFIGGLDLNERRFDTLDHNRPARETWSDIHLLMRNGPEVAEAKSHLDTFLDVTSGKRAAPQLDTIKRTMSAPRRMQFPYLSPRTVVNEIEATHIQSFRSARHLIHIERNFFAPDRFPRPWPRLRAATRGFISWRSCRPCRKALHSTTKMGWTRGLALVCNKRQLVLSKTPLATVHSSRRRCDLSWPRGIAGLRLRGHR